ncbi:hypothetical protein [Rufibacter sp. LB8]|uniref:MutS-related protein n=1 Tax=Rufibacter sp. LB8 TaxID=2777781 RepID=UPI00178C81DB|nr:hypothetical protein [Rufibacter sp. LB8]
MQKKELERQRAGQVQLILLLERLYVRFFSRLQLSLFPESFTRKLKLVLALVEQTQIIHRTQLIKQDKFSHRQSINFTQVLQQLPEGSLAQTWQSIFEFEAYFSIAKGTLKHGFNFPEFTTARFEIADFYHPQVTEPVKNSVSLTAETTVFLLTGPNMAGKSTLLKALGLCVHAARLGLPVPAQRCQIPFFAATSVSINSKDDLAHGYSHFMQELMTLKGILEQARQGKPCFAVFDEIFKGTNSEDAQEIILHTLQGLPQFRNSFFFLSTHFLNLQHFAQASLPAVQKFHIACELAEGNPIFTYQLREGWSDLKIGKLLFDQLGLPQLLQTHA